MPRLDSYRKKALHIAGLIRSYIENAVEVMLSIRNQAVGGRCADHVIPQLLHIGQNGEIEILVKIINFIIRTGIIIDHARDGEWSNCGVYFFADAYRKGKDELIDQTACFIRKNGLSANDNFFIYLRGIENFGVAEIEQGIAFSDGIVKEGSPNWENVLRWTKEYYATIASFLGFKKFRELLDIFMAEGFSQEQACHFVYKICPLKGISGCNLGEKFVLGAIQMIKDIGLKPVEHLNIVLEALESSRSTRNEVQEALKLIKDNNVTAPVDSYSLEAIIALNRQPEPRQKMLELLRSNRPGALNTIYCYTHFLAVVMSDEYGDTRVKMFNNQEVAKQARLRTKELLASRFARWGIFGVEKELVAEMTHNSLLLPDILRCRVQNLCSLDRARALAERAYGTEAVRLLLKLSNENTEAEFSLAMMQVNATELYRLLSNIDPLSRINIVRSINWHGYFPTIRAIDIVATSNLEHSFIVPLAEALKKKKRVYWWHIPVIRTPQVALATAQQERDLETFLSWPVDFRKRMGHVIELFGRIEIQTYYRISTGYVTQDILLKPNM